jgi:hypothetical protein
MITLSLECLPISGLARGLADFRNDVVGEVVFLLKEDTFKVAAPVRAQLYNGPDGAVPSALKPVGAPAPFGEGARAGCWDPSPDPVRVVPGMASAGGARNERHRARALFRDAGFQAGSSSAHDGMRRGARRVAESSPYQQRTLRAGRRARE